MSQNVYIKIEPECSLIDAETKIKILGLEPHSGMTLTASSKNYFEFDTKNFNPNKWIQECQWESWGMFRADDEGVVDLSTQIPINGTYGTKDAMGLFWSMKHKQSKTYFKNRSLDTNFFANSMKVDFVVKIGGQKVAESECTKLFISPSVEIEDVTESGIVGRFFFTPGDDPKSGIIVIGGSEGGIDFAESYAALLASHGYPALALAYYNINNLPSTLENIPLEYFKNAIEWMKNRKEIKNGVTLFGKSRGGELALLAASLFNDVKSVIAIVPSPIVFMGSNSSGKPTHTSAWSMEHVSFPFVDSKFDLNFYIDALFNTILHRPIHIEKFYLKALKNMEMVDKAFIPIEKINGPLLLISGDADTIWPSNILCEMAVDRLKQHDFQFDYKHLNYHGAGHSIMYPFLPVMETANRHDLAYANKDCWANILTFLDKTN